MQTLRKKARESSRSDKEIASGFLELFRAMKRYVREELPPFSEKGLNEEKLRCLAALRFLGKSQLKSLAAYDGLTPSSQCIMLNQLVQSGLVSRNGDPEDRRNVFYELTDPGFTLVNSALAIRIDFLCKRLTQLSTSEKSRFSKALGTVLSAVEKLKR
ncbi:MAG: MarR family winged helix-turn-helix transcriptional regulator [Spirochaetia bacterium]